ncbi:MAG: FAD-dependent oxidoreductase [Terriglobales bacterium]
MKTRPDALREIESHAFDVCVVGAGATGAGCALDAQLRGLRTVLIDAGDFASGSSSASTKLVHGGVRYLQQAVAELDLGQLKVVRQALRERTVFLGIAPHLAHTREFLVPCFSRVETLYYAVGLKLYDWFAGKVSLGRSRLLTRQQAVTLLPTLKSDNLAGAVVYQDGQFDDARYGVTLVKTFADAGGEAANYLAVVSFDKDPDGKLSSAIVRDALSGRSFKLRAHVFVNATGPFSDRVRTLAMPGAPSRLVLSKGVHILLSLTADITTALLIPETEDGRVIFAIPWLGRLLVGTTDQEVTPDQELAVTREEVAFLLRHLNRYSARPYSVEDIVGAFAGVRPLLRAKHTQQAKNLVREHEVEVDGSTGLVSILGGKWTTYRAMAEDTIDAVQKQLPGPRTPCSTWHHRLVGAQGYTPDYWQSLASKYRLPEATARHLSENFGTEASAVLAIAEENSDFKLPVVAGAAPIQAEVIYCARREMAVGIEDFLARRIGLQQFSWKLAIEAAPVVAAHLAHELGWPDSQKDQAIRDYVGKMWRRLQMIGL